MDQDKGEEIRKYKALYKKYKTAAKESERSFKIMEKLQERGSRAMRILTAERMARLFWLYGLGDLYVRIPDALRDISDVIDEAYEQWQKE